MTIRELSNAIGNAIGDVPYDSEVISIGANSEGYFVHTIDSKCEYRIQVIERGREKGKIKIAKMMF